MRQHTKYTNKVYSENPILRCTSGNQQKETHNNKESGRHHIPLHYKIKLNKVNLPETSKLSEWSLEQNVSNLSSKQTHPNENTQNTLKNKQHKHNDQKKPKKTNPKGTLVLEPGLTWKYNKDQCSKYSWYTDIHWRKEGLRHMTRNKECDSTPLLRSVNSKVFKNAKKQYNIIGV